MTPEEWDKAVWSEAEHAGDPAWAGEARRQVKHWMWRRHLIGFLLAFAVVVVCQVLEELRLRWLFAQPFVDDGTPQWAQLSVFFIGTIYLTAWFLGRKGFALWAIALATALEPVVSRPISLYFALNVWQDPEPIFLQLLKQPIIDFEQMLLSGAMGYLCACVAVHGLRRRPT